MSFLEKMKPVYDLVYKVVLFICKILLIADICITSYAVAGRYISFIDDPAWSEEVVLTLMSYMAVLAAALAIRRGAHIRMDAFDNFLPKKVMYLFDSFDRGSKNKGVEYNFRKASFISEIELAFV